MADDDAADPNPFKGTPFEHLFEAMGGAAGAGGPAQIDFAAMFQQVQHMFSNPGDGPVNFTLATETARSSLTAHGTDPSPRAGQHAAANDAVALAESWLDRATALPRASHSTAVWSRAEWIESSMPVWEVLISPIASHVVTSMSDALPSEMKAAAGPFIALIGQASGAMFGQQIGQGVAGLAAEILSSTDIGLPLGPSGTAAVLPANIAEFAEGHSLSESDVLIYVTLREAAHLRLYAHATWLRAAIFSAVEEFGQGTTIDASGIESKLRDIDPSNPAALQSALEGGLFDPEPTPAQQRAKERLELLLALVEGWVDHVVATATADTMPAAGALAETMRRRRASGGPAEDTFASLVGLELRPRRLRDASNLWASIAAHQGPEERDDVWLHPDLMPTAEDLDDPLGYDERRQAREAAEADIDAELSKLLRGDDPEPPSQ